MGTRYCFEISDGPRTDYWFAYFDTSDRLGSFLFEQEKVKMTVEGIYGKAEDPYRIVLCRIPREQRDAFLNTVDLLPGLMEYAGKKGYDDFCRGVMLNAYHHFRNQRQAAKAGMQ